MASGHWHQWRMLAEIRPPKKKVDTGPDFKGGGRLDWKCVTAARIGTNKVLFSLRRHLGCQTRDFSIKVDMRQLLNPVLLAQ